MHAKKKAYMWRISLFASSAYAGKLSLCLPTLTLTFKYGSCQRVFFQLTCVQAVVLLLLNVGGVFFVLLFACFTCNP